MLLVVAAIFPGMLACFEADCSTSRTGKFRSKNALARYVQALFDPHGAVILRLPELTLQWQWKGITILLRGSFEIDLMKS